jgi:uncharacterized protein (DUF305 family)
MKRWRARVVAALCVPLAIAGCSGRRSPSTPEPSAEPTAEVSPSTAAAASALSDSARRRHVEADVRFMQRMIDHHAQALELTRLVPTHTTRADIRLIAERVQVSQRDEMALMRRWLERHGAKAPGPDSLHAHHGGGGEPPMPGMLTAEEMSRLAGVTGTEFDRLFLRLMIRHHEGALAMVSELFSTPGAGQDPELFSFASDVDADQRAEIRRLRALLQSSSDGVLER